MVGSSHLVSLSSLVRDWLRSWSCCWSTIRNGAGLRKDGKEGRSLRVVIVLGLHLRSRTRMRGKPNLQALMRTNEGERCRSWALHQSWPEEMLALNPLTTLRKPSPLSPRRWSPGPKTWPGVKVATRGRARARGTAAKGQTKTRGAATRVGANAA